MAYEMKRRIPDFVHFVVDRSFVFAKTVKTARPKPKSVAHCFVCTCVMYDSDFSCRKLTAIEAIVDELDRNDKKADAMKKCIETGVLFAADLGNKNSALFFAAAAAALIVTTHDYHSGVIFGRQACRNERRADWRARV